MNPKGMRAWLRESMSSELPEEMLAGEGAEARWATEPERIDPDDYPPLHAFAKVMTWAPCDACRLQVHVLATQFLLAGISCPACGTRLLDPPEDGTDRLRSLLRHEDELSEQIS